MTLLRTACPTDPDGDAHHGQDSRDLPADLLPGFGDREDRDARAENEKSRGTHGWECNRWR